jgi:hypothetical protein
MFSYYGIGCLLFHVSCLRLVVDCSIVIPQQTHSGSNSTLPIPQLAMNTRAMQRASMALLSSFTPMRGGVMCELYLHPLCSVSRPLFQHIANTRLFLLKGTFGMFFCYGTGFLFLLTKFPENIYPKRY